MSAAPGFAVNLDQALAELETCTGAMRLTDPHDLAALDLLLSRRHRAIEGLAGQLRLGGQIAQGHAVRLAEAWNAGQQMDERLKLVLADTRHQLQDLHRAHCHTRALAADLGRAGQNFDLEA